MTGVLLTIRIQMVSASCRSAILHQWAENY